MEFKLKMEEFNVKLAKRLEFVLQILNGNVSELARQAGVEPTSAKRWLTGQADPKTSNLVRLSRSTGINIGWLAAGDGDPFGSVDNISPLTYTSSSIDISNFVFIPYYADVYASAGYGTPANDNQADYCLAFKKDYIKQNITENTDQLSVISVKGNSMEGLLNHGDLILVNHAKTNAADGLYVLRIGSDLFVKLTQRLPNNILRVKSTNPQYEPFDLDISSQEADTNIIGKVEWLCRAIQ